MSCRIHSTTSFNIHCLGPISLLGYTIVEQQHLPSNLFIILGYRSRDRLITSQKDGTHSAACHCNCLAQWPSAFSGRLSSQLESFHLFSACRFTFVLDWRPLLHLEIYWFWHITEDVRLDQHSQCLRDTPNGHVKQTNTACTLASEF